jgi:hypothetical protein
MPTVLFLPHNQATRKQKVLNSILPAVTLKKKLTSPFCLHVPRPGFVTKWRPPQPTTTTFKDLKSTNEGGMLMQEVNTTNYLDKLIEEKVVPPTFPQPATKTTTTSTKETNKGPSRKRRFPQDIFDH